MGISKGNAKLIIQEGSCRPYSGSILELGVQDVILTDHEFISMLKSNGYRTPLIEVTLSQNKHLRTKKYISDQYFFKSLGFDNVVSLDYSDFEGCNIIYDMNLDKPPLDLISKFDVIVDGGTMEHVFNTQNFLKNVYSMCKVGGRIIHLSPSSNQINHGFYSFSPTFFIDYYQENDFIVRKCLLLRHYLNKSYYLDILQGHRNVIAEFIASKHIYFTYVVAEKTFSSTYDKIPTQNIYKTIWEDSKQYEHDEQVENTTYILNVNDKLKNILNMLGLYNLILKYYINIIKIPIIKKYVYIWSNKIYWRRV